MSAATVAVIRIPPHKYIHVLDTNTNVTRVHIGPQTYTKQDHERVVCGPESMITVPPRHYVVIRDPVVRDADNKPVTDEFKQFRLRHGDSEIRLFDHFPEPFPLYPGESLEGGIQKLRVVERNACFRLVCTRPFVDADGSQREAGDEWLFEGPGTYIPRVEVDILDVFQARVIRHDEALKLRARRECVDSENKDRKSGEEWLVRRVGSYLPRVDEIVVELVRGVVLTDRKALHLRAIKNFRDFYGKERRAGEEWLVTQAQTNCHICDVYEQVVGEVNLITLSNRQFCVVLDPYVGGEQKLGTKELRTGEASFFLLPGERLENGIQQVHVLQEDQALLCQAREAFLDKAYKGVEDEKAADVERKAGDRWMVYGPCEYIPPVAVDIITKRDAIPLDDNEGIYVRDTRSGKVSAIIGRTYMLRPTEELWRKELPSEVEELLEKQSMGQSYIAPPHYGGASLAGAPSSARDPTRVVTFRVSHNSACQVYDYRAKTSRVVFGPDLVMLGPDEQFTIVRLSGDKPKRPNVIRSLCLMLGPDFMTDVITVETSDHARLNLTLSYNWHFEVQSSDPDANRIFNVRDFVGDACKAIASRVRGAVAAESFDNFHKYSARIIRSSVFGIKDGNRIGDSLRFEANSLVITNVDVQTVEPVDERTRESLQKSVQLAIEITTNSQEARAHHEAKREEEEAKGALERQKLKNQAQAEEQRRQLLELKAQSNAVETAGQAKAEAQALAEAARIKGNAEVEQADLRVRAMRIEADAKLELRKAEHEVEIGQKQRAVELEISRARQLAEIESYKFKSQVDAIGAETIAAIARAGPEMQAKLLQGLNLKGFLVTDGHNPINLFQTASGMVGNPMLRGGAAGAPDPEDL